MEGREGSSRLALGFSPWDGPRSAAGGSSGRSLSLCGEHVPGLALLGASPLKGQSRAGLEAAENQSNGTKKNWWEMMGGGWVTQELCLLKRHHQGA